VNADGSRTGTEQGSLRSLQARADGGDGRHDIAEVTSNLLVRNCEEVRRLFP
jgi:hypothetical protein